MVDIDSNEKVETDRKRDAKSRIILPWRMRHAIRVSVTGDGDGKTHEYQVVPPCRVGQGKDCEIPLTGAQAPDTLFEFSPATHPIRLSIPHRDDRSRNNYQISLNGEPLIDDALDLKPGSVIDITDNDGQQRIKLTVDVPESWSNRLMLFFAVLLTGVMLLVAYGIYTYQSLSETQVRISSTEERIRETESGIAEQNARIDTALELFRTPPVAVNNTFQEFDNVQRASLTELRTEFSERLREITIQARETQSRIANEDVQAIAALTQNTETKIEALRIDITEKLFESSEKIKQAQEEVLLRNAQRIESLEIEGGLFKSILANSSDAVVFIKTSYNMEILNTGERTTLEVAGTGFTINSTGLTLAPQHVMKPWLYDKTILSMQNFGIVKVLPETVLHTIWTAQQQVVLPDKVPFEYLTEDAFSTTNAKSAVLVLYAPQPSTTNEQMSTPFGIVEIEAPVAGPTDVTVLQLIDATRTFSTLTIESNLNSVEPLDEVLLLGFPLTRLKDGRSIPQAVRGFVRHQTSKLLELDSTLLPGNSGGPVLNREGNVIGMAIATLGSDSYGAAVPAAKLIDTLAASELAVTELKQQLIDLDCTPGPINSQADLQLWQAVRSPNCRPSLQDEQ